MREQGLSCDRVRLPASPNRNPASNRRGLQIIWTDHSCKKEEKIGALIKFLQQMANCPWILWWEKGEKNFQRIFYMSISQRIHLL